MVHILLSGFEYLRNTMKLYQLFFKHFLLFLLLTFFFPLNSNYSLSYAQTNGNYFYIDKDATGSNNGTSWSNAWTSFSSINWSLIQPGDVVFISGGVISKIYFETLVIGTSGSIGNNVIITKGVDLGHNGEVIIDGGNSRSNCVDFNATDDYVTVSYISMQNSTSSCVDMLGNIGGSYGSYYHNDPIVGSKIEHCKILLSNGNGIRFKGTSKCSTYHNYINTVTNTSAQTDGYFSQASSYNVYDGDSIIIRNTNPTPHCDGIQMNQDTSDIVRNCYIEQDNSKSSNAQGIYTTESFGTHYYYNNVINLTTSTSNAMAHRNLTIGNGKIEIYNNVVFAQSGASHAIWCTEQNTPPKVKNNVLRSLSGIFGTIVVTGSNLSQVSNNAITGGSSVGSGVITTNPLFTDEMGRIFTIHSSSPLIDAGLDLGTTFNVDKNGSTRPQGNGWDIGAFEFANGTINDITPPQVVSASLVNSTKLVINFSEVLNSSTAQNKNNYSISNGIIISNATLSGTQVILTTSVHVSGSYLLTVSNVTDLAGNIINPNNNTATYSFSETDVTPPELVGASIIDSVTVKLMFSEMLDGNTAGNKNNYSINNGISIFNSSLTGTEVTLTTSEHTTGSYTVTVNNVTDIAGNIISAQNNSFDYDYVNSNVLLRLPIVNADAEHWYQNYTPDRTIDGVTGGDSRWGGAVAMPDTIEYSFDDIQILTSTKLSFFNWDGGRIYNYSIQVSTDSINWNQIITNIPSLAQEWSIEEVEPIETKYIKIILLSNNQSVYAGLWESEFWGHLKTPTKNEDEDNIPVGYSLEQNYPNPFNPSTKISFSLPQNTQLKMTVYNVIGEQIATLFDGEMTAGIHQIEFNAEGLSSGIYFYRVETAAYSQTKKMILMR